MAKLIEHIDIEDIAKTKIYLRRWQVRLPFGWKIMLHHIRRADDDRCQHDHPWAFWTLILWGGYHETIGPENTRHHAKPGRIYFRPAQFRHRIDHLPRGNAWSLVLVNRSVRAWGFWTRDGWMHWRTFVDAARSARTLWCHDGTERKD